jgi:hypothetical protein
MKNWQFLFDADMDHSMRSNWTVADCQVVAEADEVLDEVLNENKVEELWNKRGSNPISPEDVKEEYADTVEDQEFTHGEWRFR